MSADCAWRYTPMKERSKISMSYSCIMHSIYLILFGPSPLRDYKGSTFERKKSIERQLLGAHPGEEAPSEPRATSSAWQDGATPRESFLRETKITEIRKILLRRLSLKKTLSSSLFWVLFRRFSFSAHWEVSERCERRTWWSSPSRRPHQARPLEARRSWQDHERQWRLAGASKRGRERRYREFKEAFEDDLSFWSEMCFNEFKWIWRGPATAWRRSETPRPCRKRCSSRSSTPRRRAIHSC